MSEDEVSASLPVGEDARQGIAAVRGDVATKAILLRLLEAMEANEAGVMRGEDPEALHDFRIALRRSRSVLGQVKEVFPGRSLRRFAPHLAWLGQATSKPRDFDVYLAGFDELKAGLPPAFQADLEPLREGLRRHAALAHAELLRQMQGRRYRIFLAGWRKFLAAPCPKRPSAPQATAPVRACADASIWKLFRRVLKQGRAVRPGSPADEIHTVRKTCKKLRYLLECFRGLYLAEEIDKPIKHLKKLQDYLGDFQDVHARIGMLRGIGEEMRQDTAIPTAALLAMGVLLAALHKREAALRREFPEHFAPFAHARNRALFRHLFRPAQEAGAGR